MLSGKGHIMNEFLSFRKFITPLIIQVIFWIGVVIYALAGLLMIIFGASNGGFLGFLGGVIGGIIMFAVGSLLVRIWCELLILLFKIYDELVAIRTGKPPEAQGFSVIQTPAQAQTPPGMG
jgi:hypothetical protein